MFKKSNMKKLFNRIFEVEKKSLEEKSEQFKIGKKWRDCDGSHWYKTVDGNIKMSELPSLYIKEIIYDEMVYYIKPELAKDYICVDGDEILTVGGNSGNIITIRLPLKLLIPKETITGNHEYALEYKIEFKIAKSMKGEFRMPQYNDLIYESHSVSIWGNHHIGLSNELNKSFYDDRNMLFPIQLLHRPSSYWKKVGLEKDINEIIFQLRQNIQNFIDKLNCREHKIDDDTVSEKNLNISDDVHGGDSLAEEVDDGENEDASSDNENGNEDNTTGNGDIDTLKTERDSLKGELGKKKGKKMSSFLNDIKGIQNKMNKIIQLDEKIKIHQVKENKKENKEKRTINEIDLNKRNNYSNINSSLHYSMEYVYNVWNKNAKNKDNNEVLYLKKLFNKILSECPGGEDESPRQDVERIVKKLRKFEDPYNSFKKEISKGRVLFTVDISGSMAGWINPMIKLVTDINKHWDNVSMVLQANANPLCLVNNGKLKRIEGEEYVKQWGNIVKESSAKAIISVYDRDSMNVFLDFADENKNIPHIVLDPFGCNYTDTPYLGNNKDLLRPRYYAQEDQGEVEKPYKNIIWFKGIGNPEDVKFSLNSEILFKKLREV